MQENVRLYCPNGFLLMPGQVRVVRCAAERMGAANGIPVLSKEFATENDVQIVGHDGECGRYGTIGVALRCSRSFPVMVGENSTIGLFITISEHSDEGEA